MATPFDDYEANWNRQTGGQTCVLGGCASKNSPVKGAQVPKVGRCERRLSQKPKFVAFFLKPSLIITRASADVSGNMPADFSGSS